MNRKYSFKPLVFTEEVSTEIASQDDFEPNKLMHMHCDGKNLYIFLKRGRKIHKFNLLSKQWKLMRRYNYFSHYDYLTMGTTHENNNVVVGSISSRYSTILLHYYDLSTEDCVTFNTHGSEFQSTFPLNLLRIGKYFYTVGAARDDDYFSDVYRINTDSKIWEAVYLCNNRDEPELQADIFMVHCNELIYIFKGAEDTISLEKIPAFDLQDYSWRSINTTGDESRSPSFPDDRWGLSYAQYNDPLTNDLKIILAGGAANLNDLLNDVWELNLSTLKWTCLERFGTTLPVPKHSAFMCVSPSGRLFSYGGETEDNNDQRSLDSKVYSTWLVIPKLTDICWDAVSHYFPHLGTMSEEEIKSIDLPWQLFEPRMNQ